ncbi:MAG: YdcF family protein, partial [Pirellulaceae bacterium]|nr:YdcF family protein [Pirellulaceae bacterium]
LGTAQIKIYTQRVLSAAQFWHPGKTRMLVCSDFPIDETPDAPTITSELLQSVGVPKDVIVTFQAKNTAMEMEQMRALLDQSPEKVPGDGKLGLITSAFHMNRSLRLAESQSLEFIPLPCGYRGSVLRPFSPRDLIPESGAGKTVSIVIKEHLAKLVGR